MKLKKRMAVLLAGVMLLTMLGACGKKDSETVTIGYIGDLSGPDAYVGVPPQLMLEDYIAQLNANGGLLGKQVKLVAYDMAADNATESVNITNRMINEDHVIAIIGPSSSSAGMAMAPLCDAAKVPFIATSATNEKVTVGEDGNLHPYAFRVCFIDPYQGKAAADYAFTQMGITSVGMVEELGSTYSQNICDYFQNEFESLGGTVVSRIGVQHDDVEFRAQLTAMGNSGVQAIFAPFGTYRIPSSLANQANDLGLEFQFIFSDSVYDDTLLEVAGANLEGAVLTNGIYADNPVYDEYKAEFTSKHSEWEANMYVFYAYDAIELLKWAVEDANSLNPEDIQASLCTATDLKLYTDEHFTVDPVTHNPLNKMVAIIGINDSKFHLVDSFYPDAD